MSRATDSARWCATHQSYGDHHTDRCPLTFDAKSPAEHEWDMMQAQRKAMGLATKPYPGDEAAARAENKRGKQGTDAKPSTAVSAQYENTCPVCGAGPKQPCRTKITKRVTDTHLPRIDAAYPNNTL